MTDDLRTKTPDMAGAFERARKEPEREKKEKLTLELRPPVPTPMGTEQQPGQVSPQLKSEERKRELAATMLVSREFNRAAHDPVER